MTSSVIEGKLRKGDTTPTWMIEWMPIILILPSGIPPTWSAGSIVLPRLKHSNGLFCLISPHARGASERNEGV
jgi:hypothetical protein